MREAADKERETLVVQKAAEDRTAAMKAMEKMVKDSQRDKPAKRRSKPRLNDLGPTTTIVRSMTRNRSASELKTQSLTMEEMTTQLSEALRKVRRDRESESGDDMAKEDEQDLLPTIYDPSKDPGEGPSSGTSSR